MREPGFWHGPASLNSHLLKPLGALYGAIAARRLRRKGLNAGIPVLCVGNYHVGGAGKTPAVLALAKLLRELGETPVVLADHSDRSGSATWLLKEIMAQDLSNTLIATITDAAATSRLKAEGAKAGDAFDMEIGGLVDESAGRPARVQGTILKAVEAYGQFWVSIRFGRDNVLILSTYLVQIMEPFSLANMDLDVGAFSAKSVAALAYLVVVGSIVAFSCYAWLLANAPISQVSTYAYVNPVIAVVLGAVFLSERVAAATVAGMALVVASVAVIVRQEARVELREETDSATVRVASRN